MQKYDRSDDYKNKYEIEYICVNCDQKIVTEGYIIYKF